MPEDRWRRAIGLISLAAYSVFLVGLSLGNVGPSNPRIAQGHGEALDLHSHSTANEANLTINPPSFTVLSGTNLSLEAIWSVESPLCLVAPLWFHWSIGDGNATGLLNATNGRIVTFTGESFDSGSVIITIQSDAVLECGQDETILYQSCTANLSVVVPLDISELEIGPNPLPPDGQAVLEGSITGGKPPYALDVSWGDGARSTVLVATPGSFAVNHSFPAGSFLPSILASDAIGDLANQSVEEALTVGSGLGVAIIPGSYIAEVGITAGFLGVEQGSFPGAITLVDCANATVDSTGGTPPDPNDTVFSCTFGQPGTSKVLFGLYSPQPGGPSVSAILYVDVVAPPRLSARLVESVGEVGRTELVQVQLSEGAMPVSLMWNFAGNGSGGTEIVNSDGDGVIALSLETVGNYAIGIVATDIHGRLAEINTQILQVDSTLAANVTGASSLMSFGSITRVAGDVLAGCSPFSWWVVPGIPPNNGSAAEGALANPDAFEWSGSYHREGNLSVAVEVADSCGSNWQTSISVTLVPVLSLDMAVNPGPPSQSQAILVNLTVQGGLPPFLLEASSSNNESWNRTVQSDGPYSWLLSIAGNGSLELAARVSDQLNGLAEANLTIYLNSPPDPGSPSPTIPPFPVVSGPYGGANNLSPFETLGLLASFLLSVSVLTALAVVRRHYDRRRGRWSSRMRSHRTEVVPARGRSVRARCRSKGRFIGTRAPDEECGRGGDDRRAAAPPDELEPEDNRGGRGRASDRGTPGPRSTGPSVSEGKGGRGRLGGDLLLEAPERMVRPGRPALSPSRGLGRTGVPRPGPREPRRDD